MNNVLQALICFFKNVETHQFSQLDKKALMAELGEFGVSLADLEKTLSNMASWVASHLQTPLPASSLQHSAETLYYPTQTHTGLRVFSHYECLKISKKSREFLIKLEKMGILNPQIRECVIDQLIQFETEENRAIPLTHTKWVIFQTLFHDAPPVHVAYLEWLLFRKMVEVH